MSSPIPHVKYFSNSDVRANCEINPDSTSDWPTWPAILTDENGDMVFPEGTEGDRRISVADGAILKMSCTGTDFESFSGESYITAT